jgi:protocatechuate 3,4-dioxygenase beta subunit
MKRRDVLRGLGAAGVWALAGRVAGAEDAPKTDAPACVLTPQQTPGPFYFRADKLRGDIREGLPGAPLKMQLWVVDAKTCAPLPGVVVDVWHADAAGRYSGYGRQGDDGTEDTTGDTFLRGHQVADDAGNVSFTTVYPGWYPGRVPHIHFRVYVDDDAAATSQLYFPVTVSQAVYQEREPYAARGVGNLSPNRDGVLRRSGGLEALQMTIKKNGEGFMGTHTIGIRV